MKKWRLEQVGGLQTNNYKEARSTQASILTSNIKDA